MLTGIHLLCAHKVRPRPRRLEGPGWRTDGTCQTDSWLAEVREGATSDSQRRDGERDTFEGHDRHGRAVRASLNPWRPTQE